MKRCLNLLLLVAITLFLTACVVVDDRRGGPPVIKSGGPPPWAPAHGRRAQEVHLYHYYPAAGVYFDVGRGTYFYLSQGRWQVGVSLPSTIVLDAGGHVTLELDTNTPYLYYADHKVKYKDAGWKAKKDQHKKGKGHGRPF